MSALREFALMLGLWALVVLLAIALILTIIRAALGRP
jgi:hypothetical protein